MKLLVVARGARLQHMIRRTLERDSFNAELLTCADVHCTLDLYQEHRPDWVLMDLDLRDGNGLAAAERLRKVWPCARVVFLTDYNDADYLAGMRASGGYDYLLKEHIHRLPETLHAPNNPQALVG